MARDSAKGKKEAHPQASEKSAQAHAQEKGICIICGEMRSGAPAEPELPIRAARSIREILKQPAKHTVACREHLAEARQHRAKFEGKVRGYLIGAAAFFALVLVGGLFFGVFGISTFMPAILGAAIIAFLPCFYYFPSFGK